jgi:hypothetical protein
MSDPGVRACSLGARGLWMDMLCIAARHDPPGYVAVNGNPIDNGTLARMVGASLQDVESLLTELDRAGVFSRNRNGIIYSRRMVRETKANAKARENGKKGGNPNLRKHEEIPQEVNPPLNPPLKLVSGIIPEARDKNIGLDKSNPRPKRKSVRTTNDDEFCLFWDGYPTDANMSKKEAFQAWQKLDDEQRKLAIESLPAFKAYCRKNPDYRPVHANRYLSKDRYLGHVATAKVISGRVFVEKGSAQWDAWCRSWATERGSKPPTSERNINGRIVTGWEFPTEWPTKVQQSSEVSAAIQNEIDLEPKRLVKH